MIFPILRIKFLSRGVMKLIEVPIIFVDRRQGASKMSRKIFAEAIGVVWKLRVDALRGRI